MEWVDYLVAPGATHTLRYRDVMAFQYSSPYEFDLIDVYCRQWTRWPVGWSLNHHNHYQ